VQAIATYDRMRSLSQLEKRIIFGNVLGESNVEIRSVLTFAPPTPPPPVPQLPPNPPRPPLLPPPLPLSPPPPPWMTSPPGTRVAAQDLKRPTNGATGGEQASTVFIFSLVGFGGFVCFIGICCCCLPLSPFRVGCLCCRRMLGCVRKKVDMFDASRRRTGTLRTTSRVVGCRMSRPMSGLEVVPDSWGRKSTS
jgi:hypothetical protein